MIRSLHGDTLVIEGLGASVSTSGLCASADAHGVRCPLAHAGLTPSLAVYLRRLRTRSPARRRQ